MTDEDLIRKLLEEALNSESTLEQVCAEFPDLLPEVRRRWGRIRRVARELDALFPPSISGDSAQKEGWKDVLEKLPQIAGYDVGLASMGIQFKDPRVAIARLYAAAFAADSKLAEDLQAGRRYRAACAAAEAGGGNGPDAPTIADDERARWRGQARDWLRADLAAWSGMAARGTATDSALVVQALTAWQADPALAGLRDRTALQGLSADEREECIAFWKEVDVVLRRARGAD
jgi:hypothetical protein